MTLLLKSQRLIAEPQLVAGDKLVCADHDGTEVEVTVTWIQPPLLGGRWVNGLAGAEPVSVWLSW